MQDFVNPCLAAQTRIEPIFAQTFFQRKFSMNFFSPSLGPENLLIMYSHVKKEVFTCLCTIWSEHLSQQFHQIPRKHVELLTSLQTHPKVRLCNAQQLHLRLHRPQSGWLHKDVRDC